MMRRRWQPQPDSTDNRLRDAADCAITHAMQDQSNHVTVQDVQMRALVLDLSVDEATARTMLQERLRYRQYRLLGLTTDAFE